MQCSSALLKVQYDADNAHLFVGRRGEEQGTSLAQSVRALYKVVLAQSEQIAELKQYGRGRAERTAG